MTLAKYEDDISGVVSPMGGATIERRPLKGTWGVLQLIAQTKGTASWTVLVNGSVVDIGRGARATLGPLLLEPNDKVELIVIAATPGSNITGHFVGIQSDLGLAELPIPPPFPKTITMETIAQSSVLKTIQNTSTIQRITIPAGTISIGYSTRGSWDPNTSISITGGQSGLTYFSDQSAPGASGSVQRIVGTVLHPLDTTVNVVIQANAQPVDIIGWQIPISTWSNPAGNLPVGQVPPWTVPPRPIMLFNAVLGANAVAPLIAGVLNQSIYLFGLMVAFSGAPPNGVFLELDGTGGTLILLSTFGQVLPFMNWAGSQLGYGFGLQLRNTTVTAIGMTVSASFNQAG